MKALDFSSFARTLDLGTIPWLDFEVGQVSGKLTNSPQSKEKYSVYDLVFCPGNSFGHMTGGFDQGVVDVFGDEVEVKVRAMIEEKYFGMMPVGASEVVMHEGRGFVYTPTMMVPTKFTDIVIPYMCMYSSLLAAHRYEVSNDHQFARVLCPLFGVGTGSSDPHMALHQQLSALGAFIRGAMNKHSNMCTDLFKDGTARYLRLLRP
ncbi:hypothetical protein D9M68_19340 [compost metagenome]